jgi:hypothetical protein
MTVEDMNYLKQGLKKLDPEYPKVDGIPESTAYLTDKELVHHLEFIRMYLGEYGITCDYDRQEWDRILKECI